MRTILNKIKKAFKTEPIKVYCKHCGKKMEYSHERESFDYLNSFWYCKNNLCDFCGLLKVIEEDNLK